MISDVLVLLKDLLNSYFHGLSGANSGAMATEDLINFVGGDKVADSVTFPLDKVSMLLFNMEQENVLRKGDPYQRTGADGSPVRVQPDIHLNLYVLFVAKFSKYELSLRYLSFIIKYFQANRYLNRQNTPQLNPAINQLSIELTCLTVNQQNELWGLLRNSYLPSVVYKVKTITFSDEDGIPQTAISGMDKQARGIS